ncbi:iron-siderophore ABC transporter substrate-binding protein [Lusitaniella coriacea]|uniref:iron-siderophore ABC transporter substrate-binding protein n=1 Tax=Lusitaniella coriacea TaxID=1983105 RepID=UPI003CEE199A
MADALALGVKPIGIILYFDELPPYLKGKLDGIEPVGIGNQPSLEKILTLNPDLIIAMNDSDLSYQQMSQIAPTVVDNWIGYPHWKKHFNFVAEVLGKNQEAKQVWANYEERIQKLRVALPENYQDIEVSFVRICCGKLATDVKNSFSGMILEDVGLSRPPAQNVEDDDGLVFLSEELITSMDGDIIFLVVDREDDDAKRIFEQLQQKPLWNQLKAVREGRVYPVNLPTWRGGNPLAADAVIDDLFKYLVE